MRTPKIIRYTAASAGIGYLGYRVANALYSKKIANEVKDQAVEPGTITDDLTFLSILLQKAQPAIALENNKNIGRELAFDEKMHIYRDYWDQYKEYIQEGKKEIWLDKQSELKAKSEQQLSQQEKDFLVFFDIILQLEEHILS